MTVEFFNIPEEILDEEEQETPRIDTVIDRMVRGKVAELRTMLPCVAMTNLNTSTNTVDVRVVVRDIFPDGTQLPEQLSKVPVRFPSAGGQSLTMAIKKGDPLVLCMCDRDIKKWIRLGSSTQSDIEVDDRRRHSYSGAYIDMGLEPNALRKAIAIANGLRLGNANTRLEIRDDNKVYLGTDTAEVITQISAELEQLLELISVLTEYWAAVVLATATVGSSAQNAAALAAIGVAAADAGTDAAAVSAAVASIKTLIDSLKV